MLALCANRFVTTPCHSSRVVIFPADSVLTWPRIIAGSMSERPHAISDMRTRSNMTIPAKLFSTHAIYEAVALPPFKSVPVRNNSYPSASSLAFNCYTPHRLISEPKYISFRNQANQCIASYTFLRHPFLHPKVRAEYCLPRVGNYHAQHGLLTFPKERCLKDQQALYTGCATLGCKGTGIGRGESCPKGCGWTRPANDGK